MLQSEKDLFEKLFDIYKNGDHNTLLVTHYATADSILKILGGKVIWSTDHRHLNDPLEIIYGLKKITRFLENFSDDHPELISAKKWLKKKFKNNEYHMLITSFVKHEDYLPCWRYYGDNGKGLAITFNLHKLQEGFKYRKIKSIFSDVIYEIQAQKNLIRDLLNCYFESKIKNPAPLTVLLLLCLPIFKHQDWKDELELRIFSPHIRMEETDSSGNSYILSELPVKKIIKDVEKLQYGLFSFEYEEIDRVTVGPCLDFTYAKNRIISELLKVGIEKIPFQIVQSKKKYIS